MGHSCHCESVAISVESIPPELKKLKVLDAHKAFFRKNEVALGGTFRIRASREDIGPVANIFHRRNVYQTPTDIVLASDHDVMRWETATWGKHNPQDAPPSFDSMVERPRLLVLFLGELCDGSKKAPILIRDAIRLRQNQGKFTWVVMPKTKPWIAKQANSAELLGLIQGLEELHMLIHPEPPTAEVEIAPAAQNPIVEAPSSELRAEKARIAFNCAICNVVAPTGTLMLWADQAYPDRFKFEDKKRIHASCANK